MDSRPQTLVYKLVIAASKKVVRTARFDAAMSLGASSDWCRVGRLLFILQMLYQSQVASPSNGRGGMFVVDECVAAVMGVWLFGW